MLPHELEPSVIGVDAGGTRVDAGLLRLDEKEPKIVGETIRIPSPESQSFERIVDEFGNLLIQVKSQSENGIYSLDICGIGLPGVYDRTTGAQITANKFKSLGGHDFVRALQDRSNTRVAILNDAEAFGLGVFVKNFPGEKRLLAITIGTGLGSAFLVEGELATEVDSEKKNIPQDGETWDIPYLSGILEDYISKRAIENSYFESCGKRREVIEIAEAARSNDLAALHAFNNLGYHLGNGLAPVILRFTPTRVAISGQIAKSFDLFGKSLKAALERKRISSTPISSVTEENYAIYGAAFYALKKANAI